ncbi:MAG: hypothetical protein JWO80_211, partial [Bryobacterales bacterium]|nr:hypothetical protein [Bryobacterales bacterium]
MTAATPPDYKATNLWNSVFTSLLPDDPGALRSLHAGPEYAPYIDRNAYQFPDQPTADRWVGAFYAQAGYGSLVRYYVTHPAAAAQRMWRSAAQLHRIRPLYLGVYERTSAHPPLYSWWRDLKSAH